MIGACGVEHLGGFFHLDVQFGGIERHFHLAEKFDSSGGYLPAWFVSVRSDSVDVVGELRRENECVPLLVEI